MTIDQIGAWLLQGETTVSAEIMSSSFLLQIGLILGTAGIAFGIWTAIRSRYRTDSLATRWPGPIQLLMRRLIESAPIALFVILILLVRVAMTAATWPSRSYLLPIAAKLALAWLVIRIATSVIRNALIVRIVAILAWCVVALNILGQTQPAIDALDSVAIVVGGLRLTPLLILKATVLLAVALWLSNLLSHFLEGRIERSGDLTPSMQVLLIKLVRVVLMVVAVVLVLSAVGIDLSALALFSGAVGVGVGLGLQKIVSNFISGVILLVDKSVKPGDLVTIGDSFGRINAMNTRYISIAAGDGREFLIPNEDLITQKVVNWTYADRNTLLKVRFSTEYGVDPRRVCKLAIDVAAQTPRVTGGKPPGCLLTDLGDSGMIFTLTFWISDPDAGMDNVRSDVMMALWDTFQREGIAIPYPTRDIRIHHIPSLSEASSAPLPR